MRIVFVRHGEPDYSKDSLTDKGWQEARLLAQRISKWKVAQFYCSPLGRARDTASCTLQKMNREAITLDWMREFSYHIDDPITGRHGIPWDFVPSFWTGQPQMFDQTNWINAGIFASNPDIASQYPLVCDHFDHLLEEYGYHRDGSFYRTNKNVRRHIISTVSADGSPTADSFPDEESEPTIVIFCHLGVTCIVLSHLINIPFPLLVHGFFLPTTSLTIVSSEERWENEAYFRIQAMGDVSHLLAGGEPVSSAGSFVKAFQG